MSHRVKAAFVLLVVVGIIAMIGYQSYKTAPIVAPEIDQFNRTHPFSPIDAALGAVAGVMMTLVLFVGFSLYEARRFEEELGSGGGPDDSGGGAPRSIRMPMSRKVVSMNDFRRAPTDGRVHREAVLA